MTRSKIGNCDIRCGEYPVYDAPIRYCKVWAKMVWKHTPACSYGQKLVADKGTIKPSDNMGEEKEKNGRSV